MIRKVDKYTKTVPINKIGIIKRNVHHINCHDLGGINMLSKGERYARVSKSKFITGYLNELVGEKTKVLDVGTIDLNGSLKPLFVKRGWDYTGVDISAGNSVFKVTK